jgi:carbon-monoxide dehydrogenase medium subunit
LENERDLVRNARIVIGAATDTPARLTAAEAALRGTRVDDSVLRRAADTAAEEAGVVSDAHGSAAYKKELVRVYVARAVRAAISSPITHHPSR